MLLLPRDLFGLPQVETLLKTEGLTVLKKQLEKSLYERSGYLATHALSFVLAGEQQIETYGGELLRIGAGSAVLLPRDLYQVSDLVPKGGEFASLLIYFGDPATLGVSHELAISPAPRTLKFSLTSTAMVGLRALTDLPPGRIEATYLQTIIAQIVAQQPVLGNRLAAISRPSRRDLKSFMSIQATKPLRVEDFAYLTGRSLSTFRRDFKATFGQAPRQWLRDRRLDHARKLMQNGPAKVRDLAREAGYENVSYFIRAFRARFGQSPKQLMLAQETTT